MPRQRKSLPTLSQLLPPVDQARYRFFSPADERPPFEAQLTAETSWANAWWLSDFSLLAYGDRDYVLRGLIGSGFTMRPEHFFDIHSTKCFIAASDHAIVVSFCGTEAPQFNIGTLLAAAPTVATVGRFVSALVGSTVVSTSDWMRNAKFTLSQFTYNERSLGHVHTGFLEGFLVVGQEVEDALGELLAQKDRSIWYTGHSLGGALAHLAAAAINKPAGLYTYGCPRVGDVTFVNAFPSVVTTQRFCVLRDPVPHVPTHAPGVLLLPGVEYRHVGNAQWLSADEPQHALSETTVPPAVVNPVRHAPLLYSNLIWNLMPA